MLKRAKRKGVVKISLPEVFSFIENPDETLEAVGDLTLASLSEGVELVVIDHSRCTQIDLCAEAVASALGKEARRRMRVRFAGHLPVDDEQREIVRAVGLPHNLNVDFPHLGEREFHCFELVRGRSEVQPGTVTTQSEKVTENLIDYVDECLGRYDHSLSDESKARLGGMVGEVITNSEDHSARRDWWVAAYLRQLPEQSWGDCHITIFNFGKSLAESLRMLPRSALLRKQIEKLVAKHRSRGLFQRDRWQDDDLWTLYALQGRVSRRNTAPDRVGDYGQGTAELIEDFQHLAGRRVEQPKMVVVSGKTYVLFDGEYPLERTDEGIRIIAFNRTNELAERPDPSYVKHLTNRFPGTLISMRFLLDKEHLDELAKRADRPQRISLRKREGLRRQKQG